MPWPINFKLGMHMPYGFRVVPRESGCIKSKVKVTVTFILRLGMVKVFVQATMNFNILSSIKDIDLKLEILLHRYSLHQGRQGP